MRKTLVSTFIVLVLLAALTPLVAQDIAPGTANHNGGTYTFSNTGPNSPAAVVGNRYPEALRNPRNAFILNRGLVRDAEGRTIAKDNPGETFYVPPGIPAFVALQGEGIVAQQVAQQPIAMNDANPGPVVLTKEKTSPFDSSKFRLLLVTLLLCVGIVALLIWVIVQWQQREREAELNIPGATAGPAFVQGGVEATHTDPAGIFQNFAALEYNRENLIQIAPSAVQIRNLTPGRIWGVLDTHFSDDTVGRHRYNGERAYRAEVLRPGSATWSREYLLDACGNPLRFGQVRRYIPGEDLRFEPDAPHVVSVGSAVPSNGTPAVAANASGQSTEVPSPEPAPVVATVATPVVPAVNEVGPLASTPEVRTEVNEPSNLTDGGWSLEFKPAVGNQPTMVRLKGVEVEDFFFSSTPSGVTCRFVERKSASE